MISLGVLLVLIVIGATVPLGERTFFGHVGQIWAADETQVLVDEVKKKSGPVYDRVKRGVKAGVDEATSDGADAGPDEKSDEKPAEKPVEKSD